ncbi:MAG: hypothetical protein EBR82_67440, partial [Caulobacteraceae bacterium]|nr:hypothetical protein [Caulobacteraceae bacterium]
MLELDGKPIDLTKPQTWGDSIKIKPNGYIEQTKDGVTIWVVTALNCLPNAPEGKDYVITVHWTCNGTDGTYNASVYSTCSLPVVQGETFIPYQDLTLEIVLGWIWANGVD